MGETVSLLNDTNLSMQRLLFSAVVLFSLSKHVFVSAYLEYYPAYQRSLDEAPPSPANNWDRDPITNVDTPVKTKNEAKAETVKKNEDQVATTTTSDYEHYDHETTADLKSDGKDSSEVESSVFKLLMAPDNTDDIIFLAITAGFSTIALVSLISLFICWYRLHKNTKAAADVEYPAYGVTGPNKELSPTGDRRLAQSAQMYHYQHQKQQIIAMESSRANNERRGSVSEADSDEENEEGDYTVYECPGLAATGEMEVKNPLFQDDPTPATAVQNTEVPSTKENK
uniref:Neural proliferation differentiation and control protein 1 n=1 Tax=Clastoptera arizonana TaxID=38151 RepID=A0A1B6C4K3_9HEMI